MEKEQIEILAKQIYSQMVAVEHSKLSVGVLSKYKHTELRRAAIKAAGSYFKDR